MVHNTAWVRRGGAESTSTRCQALGRASTVRRCRGSVRCRTFSTPGPDFKYYGEYSFNLNQYMVELEKPIGLTLAPEPRTGKILVQQIHDGSAAAESRLIQVGDVLTSCSAVFGDEMWECTDLQRTRWAINNRAGKVKMVFERTASGQLPAWYFEGKEGIATSDVSDVQLPVRFTTSVGSEVAEVVAGRGRTLLVSFNKCVQPASQRPPIRPGLAARMARVDNIRQELQAARAAPAIDLTSPVSRLVANSRSRDGGPAFAPAPAAGGGGGSAADAGAIDEPQPGQASASASGGGGGGPGGGGGGGPGGGGGASAGAGDPAAFEDAGARAGSGAAGAAAGAGVAAAAAGPTAAASTAAAPAASKPRKRVVQLLPWLLVATGRLTTQELTRLATQRAIGAVLELSLQMRDGLLVTRGSAAAQAAAAAPPPPPPPPLPLPPQPLPPPAAGPPRPVPPPAETAVPPLAPALPPPARSAGAAAGAAPTSDLPLPPQALDLPAPDPPPPSPSPRVASLLSVAAALQRLRLRQRYGGRARGAAAAAVGRRDVLLHCEAGMDEEVAAALAVWLHTCIGLDVLESCAAVQQAGLGSPPPELLQEAAQALLAGARERVSRVVLTWPYGGLSTEVSGELVGGWTERLPMQRCMSVGGCKGAGHGQFFLELKGLRPGRYYYKYIVDATWALDPFAPKDLDSAGNWNNVLEVQPAPKIESEEEVRHFGQLQAAWMAWETKLGLPPRR